MISELAQAAKNNNASPANLLPNRPIILKTPGYDPFSIKFDPFLPQRLACGASQNFGMKGVGRVYIFPDYNTNSTCNYFDFPDAVYDVCWSEGSPGVCVVAVADGSIRLIRVDDRTSSILAKEHAAEVSALDWNLLDRHRFASASYDSTIKIWDPTRCAAILTLKHQFVPSHSSPSHPPNVHQAKWSPKEPFLISSVTSDGSICLWDVRSAHIAKEIRVGGGGDILCLDWNKWNPTQIATGGTQEELNIWDWRNVRSPIKCLLGHQRSIKAIKWSPWRADRLWSTGYDMCLRAWDLNGQLGVWEDHSEFVMGVDACLDSKSSNSPLVATCSWDQSIALLRPHHWGQLTL